jgi:hypothetical protein
VSALGDDGADRVEQSWRSFASWRWSMRGAESAGRSFRQQRVRDVESFGK